MRKSMCTLAAAALGMSASLALADIDNDMFIIRDLSTSPDDAAAGIRDYVDQNEDWVFLSQFGMLGGDVLALKICYAPLAADVVAAGMHVMALMPCGHLAFYEEDGQARLSMLNLEFMTALNPDENLQRAVETGAPAFAAMLEEVLAEEAALAIED